MGDEYFVGTCRSVQVEVKVKMVVERIILSWINVMLLWGNVIEFEKYWCWHSSYGEYMWSNDWYIDVYKWWCYFVVAEVR